jgi:hypothetical protein
LIDGIFKLEGGWAELFYWRKKNNLKSAHKKIFKFFSNDLKLYLRRKKRGQGLWCLTPLATTFHLYHDKQGKNKHKN